MPSRSSSSSSHERKRKKKAQKAENKSRRQENRGRSRSRSEHTSRRGRAQAQEPSPPQASSPPQRAAAAALRLGPAVPSDLRRIAARSRSRDNDYGPRAPSRMEQSWGIEPPSGMLTLELSSGTGESKGKGKGKGKNGEPPVEKEQPNFEASGLLAMEDNSKNGVSLKFTMPPESRKATIKWRLYVFSKASGEAPKIVHIHRQNGYLFGKDRRVADIPTDHQTCSKQHAVLHYRRAPDGNVKPYVMDLESKNGTFLNGKRIEDSRYYELKEKDVLKFAMSSREYVLLHASSTKHLKIDPNQLLSDSE